MIFTRYREKGENQADDKDVINRQRLFDEEARIIFHAHVGALLEPDPQAEEHRNADVESRELQALGDAHFLVLLVQDAQVESGQRDHNAQKR